MLCGEALLVKKTPDEIGARLLRCRSWGCEICKPQRQKELIARAYRGNPTRFLTLTVNPGFFNSVEDRARRLVRAWRIVRQRAQRRYKGQTFPFFAVLEATKRGEAHLHVLARFKWLDQDWLSAQMEELIGAPVVDVRSTSNQRQVAAYVAKYVGKAPHRFASLKRYWCSRDYEQEKRPPRERDPRGEAWEMETKKTLWDWCTWIGRLGAFPVREGQWWVSRGPPLRTPAAGGWLGM